MKTVCITGALGEEINFIKERLQLIRCKRSNLFVLRGKFKGLELLLIKTGVGKKNAARSVKEVIEKFPIDFIISIGFAGGVNKRLRIGDLLICNPVVNLNNNDKIIKQYSDEMFLKKAYEVCKNLEIPFHLGAGLTVDKIISSVDLKREIKKKYNVLAVEMENSAIAETASSMNIPFIMVRSVSDSAFDNIQFLDNFKGSFTKLKADLQATYNSELIKDLGKLKNAFKKASKNLSVVIVNFLEKISED